MHVDGLPVELQNRYWQKCRPDWGHHDREELHEIIDRLLLVNRPRAALNTIRFELKHIESKALIRLLTEVATKGCEPAGRYQFNSYDIGQAFGVLDRRPEVSRDELAHLEFLYLGALEHEDRGIPNLERQLADSPSLFMEAIALAYKRDDSEQDPPEWRIANEGARRNIGTHAYHPLHKVKRIPGIQDDGTINVNELIAWTTGVRTLCKAYGREEVGDSLIGSLQISDWGRWRLAVRSDTPGTGGDGYEENGGWHGHRSLQPTGRTLPNSRWRSGA